MTAHQEIIAVMEIASRSESAPRPAIGRPVDDSQ
jgi:hypothetical protein